MLFRWVAGALACALLGAERANACATVAFSPASLPVTNWDPINGSQVEVSFTASITRDGAATRSFRVIFVDSDNSSQPLRLGSAGPIYQLQTAAGATMSYPQGTTINQTAPATVATISNSNNATVQTSFKIVVPANTAQQDFVGNATFSETPALAIQCLGNSGNSTGNTSVTGPTFSLTIPKLVSIITAGPQTLNFGNFTSAQQQLSIGLKSTSNINVSVATQNNNRLALAGAAAPLAANSVIPYTMTLNGKTIANGTSLLDQTRAGVAGTSWPFVLALTGGIPAGKVAGTYSDTITLTLTPN